jgi:hypothetical protein
MTNKKFATGAFVFTRAKGLVPRFPEDIVPIAERHGIDPSVIPAYAGDRAAVGRAIARTDIISFHDQIRARTAPGADRRRAAAVGDAAQSRARRPQVPTTAPHRAVTSPISSARRPA